MDILDSDQQRVTDLDIEYQAAVERNDPYVMGGILAEDFVLIDGRGRVHTREELLASAHSGRVKYDRQRATDRTVRVWNDTAVVTALLDAAGRTKEGSFEYRLWYSDTYVRLDGDWRYVLGQASTRLLDQASNVSTHRASIAEFEG